MAVNSNETISIIRHHRKSNFVVVEHTIVYDQRISWKAKGLLMYLLSQADGWQFYESEITRHSKDGRVSTATGLLELEAYGYLVRSWIRDEKGRYVGREWDVYEIPIENCNTDGTLSDCRFPEIGKADSGKTATNKNNNNKNNNNTPPGEEPLPGCCCESENHSKTEEKAQETLNIEKTENPNAITQDVNTGSEKSEPGQGISGSKLALHEIKEIMGQYKIKIWKPEVFAALSEYTESELHIIGQTLQKKKSDGKVKNPSALLAKNAEAVCVDILCGEFYAHQQNTAPKSRPSEYEIYVPPQYDGV